MLTIHINQDYEIYKPSGLLFLEKKRDAIMEVEFLSLRCDGAPSVFSMKSAIDDSVECFDVPQRENYIYAVRISVSRMRCCLYSIFLDEHPLGQMTISPEFSNMQMCTLLTSLAKPLLPTLSRGALPFNWLHLTPVHKPGSSKSAYSLLSWEDTDMEFAGEELRALGGYKIMADVVLNHLSSDAPLLINKRHSFNNVNRPDLKPAIVLDFHLELLEYSILNEKEPELSMKNFKELQKQPILEDYFMTKFSQVVSMIMENTRIYEFEEIDIVEQPTVFTDYTEIIKQNWIDIVILNGKRRGATLNQEFLKQKNMELDNNQRISLSICYNQFIIERFENEKEKIVSSIINSAKYELFSSTAKPKWFILHYFALLTDNYKVNNGEELLENFFKQVATQGGYEKYVGRNGYIIPDIENDNILIGACNGWVMGLNRDFIAQSDRAYIKREVISWGDCVKLNYENNDELLQYAIKYVKKQASLFNGLRIDNAHNTDESILATILREARKCNPELLIMLEIFTGDERKNAQVTQECNGDITLFEMVHCGTCEEVASMVNTIAYNQCETVLNEYSESENYSLTVPKLLFDTTHDNAPFGSHGSGHSIKNYLVYFGIGVFAMNCGISTIFGADQGISEHIEVNSETPYSDNLNFASFKFKQELLTFEDTLSEFDQCYAASYTKFLTVERESSELERSIILIAVPNYNNDEVVDVECTFDGVYEKEELCYVSEGKIVEQEHQGFKEVDYCRAFTPDVKVQEYLSSFEISLSLPSGSVLVIEKKDHSVSECTELINELSSQFKREFLNLSYIEKKQFLAVTEMEEVELTGKKLFSFNGVLPSICGFDGIKDCILTSTVASEVAENLRNGNWFYDYVLERHRELELPVGAFDSILHAIRDKCSRGKKPIATYLLFSAFNDIISKSICTLLHAQYDSLISDAYRAGLVLISVRPQWSNIDVNKYLTDELRQRFNISEESSDTSKSDVSDKISKRRRLAVINFKRKQANNSLFNLSIAAGLPHFCDGMFRSWGRDIALSIDGLIREKEPLEIMLVSTGALLRHGLLPNLEDSGRQPRYNCRDSVWYWLCNIVDFIEKYDDCIMNDVVKRLFLSDNESDYYYDEIEQEFLYNEAALLEMMKLPREQTIKQIVLEILRRHWDGISFTEWKCQDSNMKPEGKSVSVYVDKATGLIYGGNIYNCHTWMDKMGGSQICGNRGIPSTSRCGADVEINLCARRVLTCIKKYYQEESFVEEWERLINENIVRFKLEKNNRVYLKDVISYEDEPDKSQDELLRPNYLIGLSFQEPTFIKKYQAEVITCFENLLEKFSIGMKTLAPFEKRYHSWYNNDDCTSFETGNGFSYHNGPEWCFCYGRGLMCLKKLGLTELYQRYLVNIRRHFRIHANVNGDYKSLPELTQGNGAPCLNSCTSQSWSLGSLLLSLLQQ